MEKKILNELNQFKLLTNYNPTKTLTENKVFINEGIGGELETLIKTFLHSSQTLKSELKSFITNRKIVDELGRDISKVKDLETALSMGTLTQQTVKDLKTYLVNTSKDVNVVNSIIDDAVKSTGFASKYSKLTAKDALTELINKGYTSETANKIINRYASNGGKFKIIENVFNDILVDLKSNKKSIKIWNLLSDVEKSEFKEYVTANIQKGNERSSINKIADKWISNKGINQDLKKGWVLLKNAITIKSVGVGVLTIIAWALSHNKIQILDAIKGIWNWFYDEKSGGSSTSGGTQI